MKRGEMFFIIVIFLFLPLASASLGISPARYYVDFKPGMELEYSFNVYGDSGQRIEIYSAGEFSDLVEFDKKELVGGGGFNVKIKLPESIEKPGKHILLIGAREKIEEERGVATSVAVQAPIVIFVPYPGKYAEIIFTTNNANVGEPVKFEVTVSSMGEESITAETSIEIYSDENLVEILDLGIKDIENQKNEVFKKILDSTNYNPGDYKATAIVDYDAGIAKAEAVFRIGHLFVNINNYTMKISKPGIKPFNIDIESLWNNNLENVYAEVYLMKDEKDVINFMTASISLSPWERKTLPGYIDTDILETGDYDVSMKLNYAGNFSLLEGKLKVEKKNNILVYSLILGILIVLFICIYLAIKFLRRKDERKKKAKK